MGAVTQHHSLGKLNFIKHTALLAYNPGSRYYFLASQLTMLALTASLCVSSLALVSGHKLDGAQFGSKSSYFTVANQDASSLENYGGCEPLMMWMYIRHGSRNPGDDEILDMTSLLPELRDKILAAADAGEGSLTFKEIMDLKDWTLDMAPTDEKLLTESGKLEGLEMGKRWRQRLPNFLGDENNVESRASYKSRTIETGNSFLEGLELPQTTYVDNSKSIYYKNEFGCDRYEQEVYDNDNVTEAEAIRFTEGQAWSDMIQGVSLRTGVQVTPSEARLAHKMCKYQLAWEPERYNDADYTTAEFPPWCNLFTKEDMALWEFENDLEAHYGSGPAFEITTMAPHKLFDDWGTEKQEHKWKISDVGPFAANMGLILYSCSEGAESKVMLLHNEHIIEEQPACGETLCTVADFKAYYQHIVDFDWDTECPVPGPENATDYYDDTEVTTEAVITDLNAGGGESTTEADKNNSVESDEIEDCDSEEE